MIFWQQIVLSFILLLSTTNAAELNVPCKEACIEQYGSDAATDMSVACSRGCRFSAINLMVGIGNSESHECDGSCASAYTNETLLDSCKFGCAHQRSVSPMEELFSSPGFGRNPMMSPSTFMNDFISFFDDMTSAVSKQLPPSNGKPVGFVRIISTNNLNGDEPDTRLISVKLGDNDDVQQELFPPSLFFNDLRDDGRMPIVFQPSMKSYRNPRDKCLAPTYDSVRGPTCRMYIPRWQFNARMGRCEKFVYGGCNEVENMFSSESECISACSDFIPRPSSRRVRSFEMSLLLFCFGALGICALFGAISSMCMHVYRRQRRAPQYGHTYISASHGTDDASKVFLVGPRMDWKPTTLPPTYSDVVLASKEQATEGVKSTEPKVSNDS